MMHFPTILMFNNNMPIKNDYIKFYIKHQQNLEISLILKSRTGSSVLLTSVLKPTTLEQEERGRKTNFALLHT